MEVTLFILSCLGVVWTVVSMFCMAFDFEDYSIRNKTKFKEMGVLQSYLFHAKKFSEVRCGMNDPWCIGGEPLGVFRFLMYDTCAILWALIPIVIATIIGFILKISFSMVGLIVAATILGVAGAIYVVFRLNKMFLKWMGSYVHKQTD
jgi:hypothetical protein